MARHFEFDASIHMAFAPNIHRRAAVRDLNPVKRLMNSLAGANLAVGEY